MHCIFIYGPAAAGKLTVAKALRERTGLRLFHNHYAVDAALALFDFGTPGFVRLREAIWLAAFREAAAEGQSFIFTFHPEASVPASFVDRAGQVIRERGGTVLFIELTCSEAVIESRIGAESRASFQKLTSLEQYRVLRGMGAFDYPSMPEPDLRLATDELSADEAAEAIAAAWDWNE